MALAWTCELVGEERKGTLSPRSGRRAEKVKGFSFNPGSREIWTSKKFLWDLVQGGGVRTQVRRAHRYQGVGSEHPSGDAGPQ